jgi:hypothetical protein
MAAARGLVADATRYYHPALDTLRRCEAFEELPGAEALAELRWLH